MLDLYFVRQSFIKLYFLRVLGKFLNLKLIKLRLSENIRTPIVRVESIYNANE